MKKLLIAFAMTLASAVPAFAQTAQEEAIAVLNTEEWVLEYPTIISALVNGYYKCLRNGSYAIGDGRNFAEQHDEDIARCAELGTKNEAESNATLAKFNKQDRTPPAEVRKIFATVRNIHQARGRDIDKMFTIQLATSEQAANAPQSECMARISDLRAEQQTYADAQKSKLREVWDTPEVSDEDRKVFAEYSSKLEYYAQLINRERRSCAASS